MVFNGTWIFCPKLPHEVEPPARKCNCRALKWQLSEVQQPCLSTESVRQDGGFSGNSTITGSFRLEKKRPPRLSSTCDQPHLVTQPRAPSAVSTSVLEHLRGWGLQHLPVSPFQCLTAPSLRKGWKLGAEESSPQEPGERILTQTTHHQP